MPKTITSFNGGLFSSYLRGRTELEKYHSALQDASNYHLLPFGTLQNRAGTYFIGNEISDDMRLITFQYNINQSYVLVLSGNTIKIINNDAFQTAQLISPWTTSQLHQIQYVQVADTMYLVHPEVAPQIIVRETGTSWSIKPMDFGKGPFLPYNLTDITLKASATTGNITLTASSALFTVEDVGRTVELKHVRTDNTSTATSASYSPWIKVKGNWSFSTRGTWTGTVRIYRRVNGGTQQAFRSYLSSNDNNYKSDGEESEDNVEMRVYGATDCTATLTVDDFFSYGVGEIISFTDDKNVECTTLADFGSTDTTQDWAYNAFSQSSGFPTAIALWNERMCLGGTLSQPSTIFLSKIDEWENFQTSNSLYDSLLYKINTSETIMWIDEQGDLVIGTSGNEYKLETKHKDEPLSGDNVKTSKQGAEGSTNIQAITAGDTLIFVTRDNQRAKTIAYSFEADKLKARDLNALAGSEITDSGIRQAVYKQNPYSELYFVLNDGSIAILTYDQEQEIYGWTKFHTNGKYKSACVLKGTETDIVYFAVERTINGVTSIYIEKMLDRKFKNRDDWFFVDCGLTGTYSTPTNTVTGLDHLEGEEVTLIVDGGMHRPVVVNGGQIVLDREYSTIHVGLKYQSYAQTMSIDDTDGRNSNQSSRKKLNKLYLKIRDTVGLESGASLDKLEHINIHGTSNTWLSSIQPITDMITINIDSSHDEEYAPYFVQSLPQAQEILGYCANVSIGG